MAVKLFPYLRLTFKTAHTIEEVSARIASTIAPRGFSWKTPVEPFRGSAQGRHFKATRVIRGRNSFLPVVIGEIAQGASGADVHVRMRLHWLVAAFMLFWFAGFLGAGAPFVQRPSHPLPASSNLLALRAVIAVFAYAVFNFFFWAEAAKARMVLRDALDLTDRDIEER
jgi:hypothetical protein